MPARGRVVLGGTFDRLHLGHEALLGTAFRLGGPVAIGLTTGHYLAAHPKPGGRRLQPYATRRRALGAWLRRRYPRRRWTVVPISDPFGGSTGPGVRALVVSADTRAGGRAVNRERARLGRPAVPVVVVPLVLADDLRPISSRRIRAGEIDRWGRRRSPLRIRAELDDPLDRPPVASAVRAAFPAGRLSFARRSPRGGRAGTPAATGHADLVLRIRGRGPGPRTISLASVAVRVPAQPAPGRPTSRLRAALLASLRRSDRAKRYSPRRR